MAHREWHRWDEIWFCRHGKTHQVELYPSDRVRQLTVEGIRKTTELKSLLGHGKFDLIISSPVDRATVSCNILFPNSQITLCPELYLDTKDRDIGEAFDELFGQHGYQSAEFYRRLDPQLCAEVGNLAAVKIAEEIRRAQAKRVFVMSHAVVCQLAAGAMVGHLTRGLTEEWFSVQTMLGVQIQEASGFVLNNQGAVRFINEPVWPKEVA